MNLRAAGQGLALAEYSLGTMYEEGKGVQKDLAEAVRRYRRAAEQGIPASRERLGKIGRNAGNGV